MKSLIRVASIAAFGAAGALSYGMTFFGSSGNLAAEADFSVVSNQLVVTLTNTSTADVLVPSDVLTAVFFNVTGDPTFSKVSAVVAPGSSVLFGTTDPGGVVGGEWAYLNGLSQFSANEGISSTGLGIFGPGDVFPGSNLQGPTSPDGLQYGITSAGDNPLTGNTPVTGTNALIKNSVVFTLGNVPVGFELNSIGNVTFLYGTALTEPNVPGHPPGVPGPWAAIPFVFGLAAGLRRRRR